MRFRYLCDRIVEHITNESRKRELRWRRFQGDRRADRVLKKSLNPWYRVDLIGMPVLEWDRIPFVHFCQLPVASHQLPVKEKKHPIKNTLFWKLETGNSYISSE